MIDEDYHDYSYKKLVAAFPNLEDEGKFVPLYDFIQGVIHYYDSFVFNSGFAQVRITNYSIPIKEDEVLLEVVVNGQPIFSANHKSKPKIRQLGICVNYDRKNLQIIDNKSLPIIQFTFDNFLAFGKPSG